MPLLACPAVQTGSTFPTSRSSTQLPRTPRHIDSTHRTKHAHASVGMAPPIAVWMLTSRTTGPVSRRVPLLACPAVQTETTFSTVSVLDTAPENTTSHRFHAQDRACPRERGHGTQLMHDRARRRPVKRPAFSMDSVFSGRRDYAISFWIRFTASSTFSRELNALKRK